MPTFDDNVNLPGDIAAAVTYADKIGGLLKGTRDERLALTASQVSPGWLFTETDTGSLYLRLSSGWRPLFGGKTNFVPSWVNFIPNTSAVTAWYQIVGSKLEGFVRVTLATGFTLNTLGIEMVPPVAPAAVVDGKPAGDAIYAKAGTGYWQGALLFGSSGRLRLVHASTGGGGYWGGVTNSTPFGGWSNSDVIMLSFQYEV